MATQHRDVKAAAARWDTGPLFLGKIEPRLMEAFLLRKFMVKKSVLDVAVTATAWGRLEGYMVCAS